MYGISAIRVDGGDARAMYNAVREARRLAVELCRPVLIEAMSYRSGHHSTSDDSSRYRTVDEMQSWRARDPVARFRQWLELQGWWSDKQEQEARKASRQQVCWLITTVPRRSSCGSCQQLIPRVSPVCLRSHSGNQAPKSRLIPRVSPGHLLPKGHIRAS